MSKSKIIGILSMINSLVLVSAVKIWAPVCTKMTELANGSSAPMRCHYYGQILFLIGIIMLIESILIILPKDTLKVPCILLITGLLILILTNPTLGIGVCVKEGMQCHTTALVGRISGVLAILFSVLTLLLRDKSEN